VPTSVAYAVTVAAGDDHSLAVILGTDPLDPDTDDDGMLDGWEVTYGLNTLANDSGSDEDSDGLTNLQEHGLETNPLDIDSDDDALEDGAEVNTHGTDPLAADSDNDGLEDGLEINTQGTDPLDPDSDDDGLADGDEVNTHGTDPLDNDSDGDGFDDACEVAEGLSPTNDNSSLVDYIMDNQPSFGLYTEEQLGAMAVGDLMIQSSNAYMNLWLQLMKSDDLVTWTNAGGAVEWSMPAGDKEFYKVRAEP
jgi:hypothetical protein